MIRTLYDAITAGEEWPMEIGKKIDVHGNELAVCICGRVCSVHSIYHVVPDNIPVSDRLPGRSRRGRMTTDRKRYAERAAGVRVREPEISPSYICNVCLGAICATLNITQTELDRKIGHEAL